MCRATTAFSLVHYIYISAMKTTDDATLFDVIIIGAGPAGCACALALRNSGLHVALVEKSSFPRDKVCGDAIPGRAVRVLKQLGSENITEFENFSPKLYTKRASVFYEQRQLTFNWVLPAYTCTRFQFDNFLFSLVTKYTGTKVFTNTKPGSLIRTEDGITVVLNGSTTLSAPIIIGADGAQSVVAKQLARRVPDRRHTVGSVRAYYSGIDGLDPNNIALYFSKKLLPGYFWIFPVADGLANVGFGMLSADIASRRMNIKDAFYNFIDTTPAIKEKFTNAIQVGGLEGFILPLGSKLPQLSGDNFMLTGDAASLVDPITGEGIGNAMLSGSLAALQVQACFSERNFSAATMKNYDKSLLKSLGNELKRHYKAQRILSKAPFLLDLIFTLGKSKMLRRTLEKQF